MLRWLLPGKLVTGCFQLSIISIEVGDILILIDIIALCWIYIYLRIVSCRRAVRQAEELKEQYEVKESKLKTSFAGELSSLEKEKFDSIKDMNRKVKWF
jgi:predicted membrane protein